ncbi:acetolactate synthase small subunit [Niabella ginsengisoli]|uniref:Acetolactate synthase small subunit n=1 Tax=Niabella ginsengisoli TaxID=522298 RepID=A0ABS9SJC6_9BACT|nr:acetolactate synthase small subunit [Niabella ginsengisoli]MCH5598460.1 acetolactate synthase small subunit [Niabella ginsengisoli]
MKQQYTITVYAEDHIGLLSRICIIFSRRKINIDSLNTSSSEVEGIHRFNILIDETEEVVKKLCKQIEKQVEVLRAFYNTNDEIVWQELALYKVPTIEVAEKMVVERILRKYGARVVCVRPNFTVFESTGHTEDTEDLIKKLGEYNLVEFVRGGRVAIMKDSEGFHKRLKEFEYKEPGEEVIENEFLEKGENIFSM